MNKTNYNAQRLLIALLLLIPVLGSCGNVNSINPRALVQSGIDAVENNDPDTALEKLDAFLKINPLDCEARYVATLASTQLVVRDLHLFNKGIFNVNVREFEEYEDLVPEARLTALAKSLVEQFLIDGLLIPVLEHAEMMIGYAAPVTQNGCTTKLSLPWRLNIGRNDSFDLLLEKIWGSAELRVLTGVAYVLKAFSEILISLNLNVPVLTLADIYGEMDRRDLFGMVRAMGRIPARDPEFMNWHPDSERASLFVEAENSFARSFDLGASLAQFARGQLAELSITNQKNILSVLDTDSSLTLSPGDRLILNLGGTHTKAGEAPDPIYPEEFRISEYLDPRPLSATEPESGFGFKVLDRTIEYLHSTASLLRLEKPIGTRMKIEDLNGLFKAFGFNRPFEDVAEWDPNAFFRGRPADETATHAWPEGVTAGPKTQYIVSGSSYPNPPAPATIRSMLPWYYYDFRTGDWEFAIEGEKSQYAEISYMPLWLTFGDFDHFFFDIIPSTDTSLQGGGEVSGLHLLADCVRPPDNDILGLVTVPYVALRDPTLGGSLVLNINILSGGDCADDTPDNTVWNPASHYTLSKVVAHFVARFGLNVIDFVEDF